MFPNKIHIIRGNHECSSISKVYGFYDEIKHKNKSILLTDSLFNFKKGLNAFDILPGMATSSVNQDNVFLQTDENLFFYKFYDPKIFIFSNEFDSLINYITIPFSPAKQDLEDTSIDMNSVMKRAEESERYPFGIFELNQLDSRFIFTYLYNSTFYTAHIFRENNEFQYKTYQYYFKENNKNLLMPPIRLIHDQNVYFLLNKEFFDEHWRQNSIIDDITDFFKMENNPVIIKSKNSL